MPHMDYANIPPSKGITGSNNGFRIEQCDITDGGTSRDGLSRISDLLTPFLRITSYSWPAQVVRSANSLKHNT
jgi:hypothetical protein